MTPSVQKAVAPACSFCCTPHTEVGTLVAGAGVFICDECVALCGEVIAGKPRTSGPHLAPWDQVTSLGEVLDHLPRVAAAQEQVEGNLRGWVLKARAMGATWARIGASMGMTRQSAWGRFSGEE